MGWKDLLQQDDETISLPWIGGRMLRHKERTWKLGGRLPEEHGWYTFKLSGRTAKLDGPCQDIPEGILFYTRKGYLVGDRFVPDDIRVVLYPNAIFDNTDVVHLIEPGLDRFARVQVGRVFEDGPLIYQGLDMPLGPESDVLEAFLEQKPDVNSIASVNPALDAAFRMETFQRQEAERRRQELERLRREEEERLAAEACHKALLEQVGTAVGRRALAIQDFAEAARNALRMSGATYLDHRVGARANEMVVRFRHLNRRFECVCDRASLRIIDAGICLTAHYDDPDWDEGTKGDQFFTLESLPAVIAEADREHKLVIFRHVN